MYTMCMETFDARHNENLQPEIREIIERHEQDGHQILEVGSGRLSDTVDSQSCILIHVPGYPGEEEIEFVPVSVVEASRIPATGPGHFFDFIRYMDATSTEPHIELLFREPRDFTDEEEARIEARAQELRQALGERASGPIL